KILLTMLLTSINFAFATNLPEAKTTDIVIINTSPRMLIVHAEPILSHYHLYASESVHITDPVARNFDVIIMRSDGVVFNNSVCPQAVITVSNDATKVTINTDLCY